MTARVAVAMSGGVDSSAAAALVLEQGERPFGVTMRLFGDGEGEPDRLPAAGSRTGRCCGGDDAEVARAAAAVLDIPFFVLDFEEEFRRHVIDAFVSDYRAGRTPIPCSACNHVLKFDRLLARARGMGADVLHTGHYARRERDPASGRWRIRRAADREKDQTYFLYGLTQQMLEHVDFPVGALSKDEVRDVARRWRLPNADKPESQDICFVPDGDYRGFVDRQVDAPEAPGEIVDEAGTSLGHHAGLSRFTVGQRRGLGVAGGRRLYVVTLEPETRRVVVGPRESTAVESLETGPVNWVSRDGPSNSTELQVQIRHRHRPAHAQVQPLTAGRCLVRFREPVDAAAPGQAAVFYDGEWLVGGGVIESTSRAVPAPA